MRILVVDQDSEMLEAVARSFEIDVATSKATCIDLMRANEFDVLVACERLSDGSGLELLSQVAQRWPDVVRVLSIERTRRALLRGRLGPFKLYETIRYPIDEYELEGVLERVVTGQQLGANRSAPPAHPVTLAPAPRGSMPQAPAAAARGQMPAGGMPSRAPAVSAPPSRASNSGGSPPRGQPPGGSLSRPPAVKIPTVGAAGPGNRAPNGPASRAPIAPSRSPQPTSPPPRGRVTGPGASAPPEELPPLPRRGSKIVPVGAPGEEFRILPHSQTDRDYVTRAKREQNQQAQPSGNSVHEKAKGFAVGAVAAVSAAVNRYMKHQPTSKEVRGEDAETDPAETTFTGIVRLPTTTPPYRKR